MLIGSFDIKPFIQKLVLESSLESMDLVEQLLGKIRLRYAVCEEQYTAVWIVLNEAVTNAVRHGNNYDAGKKVSLSVEMLKKRYLVFTIRDEGKGFDYTGIPDPTSKERIAEPGGRGIFLMKKLADRIVFSDGGSTLKISFDLQKNSN